MLVRKCQKNFEHGTHMHSYNVILTVCFSSVNKTVNKELHVMQNKIIRCIKGFDNRKSKYDIVPKPCKQILHFTQLKVYKMYIFPTYLPTQYKHI